MSIRITPEQFAWLHDAVDDEERDDRDRPGRALIDLLAPHVAAPLATLVLVDEDPDDPDTTSKVPGCAHCGETVGGEDYPWQADGSASIDRSVWLEAEPWAVELGEFEWYDTEEDYMRCSSCDTPHAIPSDEDLAALFEGTPA